MVKTFAYNKDSQDLVWYHLKNREKQGTPRDYEIRIDDLVVVKRTNDLKKFHLFKQSLTKSSSEVCFVLYKGKSRRSDQYILVRDSQASPDPNMTPQEYINHKVAEALEKERQESELSRLRRKTKSQKVKISGLRERVAELEAKNKGDLQELLKMASGFIAPSSDLNTEGKINGISDQNLVKMISHYRNQFGEAVFGEALGIALKVAENPKLIEPIKVFINENTDEDGKE